VEGLGLLAADAHALLPDDAQPRLLDHRVDRAGEVAGGGIRLDDRKGTLDRHWTSAARERRRKGRSPRLITATIEPVIPPRRGGWPAGRSEAGRVGLLPREPRVAPSPHPASLRSATLPASRGGMSGVPSRVEDLALDQPAGCGASDGRHHDV